MTESDAALAFRLLCSLLSYGERDYALAQLDRYIAELEDPTLHRGNKAGEPIRRQMIFAECLDRLKVRCDMIEGV